MPRVSHKIIGQYEILIPENEEEFILKMNKFLEAEDSAQFKISSSKALQKSLINQLF